MTFPPGVLTVAIRIFIIDDYCPEFYDEYFRVQLFLPGGDALVGPNYVVSVRIDDDDTAVDSRVHSQGNCARYHPEYSSTSVHDIMMGGIDIRATTAYDQHFEEEGQSYSGYE